MVAERIANPSNRNVVQVRVLSSALSRPSAIRGILNNCGMHIQANVAEMVNALDLKSSGQKWLVGSNPTVSVEKEM